MHVGIEIVAFAALLARFGFAASRAVHVVVQIEVDAVTRGIVVAVRVEAVGEPVAVVVDTVVTHFRANWEDSAVGVVAVTLTLRPAVLVVVDLVRRDFAVAIVVLAVTQFGGSGVEAPVGLVAVALA